MSLSEVQTSSSFSFIQEKREEWRKPLAICLVIIGLLGMTAIAVGLGTYGAHQYHWPVGTLGKLTRLDAIIMMTVGSSVVVLTVGIALLATKYQRRVAPLDERDSMQHNIYWDYDRNTFNRETLAQKITKEHQFTLIRQPNGQYMVVVLASQEEGFKIAARDIPAAHAKDRWLGMEFIRTSYYEPTEWLIERSVLQQQLPPNSFTLVSRVDGGYDIAYPGSLRPPDIGSLRTSTLGEDFQNFNKKRQFVETSPLPENMKEYREQRVGYIRHHIEPAGSRPTHVFKRVEITEEDRMNAQPAPMPPFSLHGRGPTSTTYVTLTDVPEITEEELKHAKPAPMPHFRTSKNQSDER